VRDGGVLETTLYGADVSRAVRFYRRLFGFGMLVENERLISLEVAGRNGLLPLREEVPKSPLPCRIGLYTNRGQW
jgi:catechol-2,3-dioxygenase